MNNEEFIDGGHFILSESENYAPPISIIYYEYYTDIQEVNKKIISKNNITKLTDLPFGSKIGTSSPRRFSQIKNIRPDINIVTRSPFVPSFQVAYSITHTF